MSLPDPDPEFAPRPGHAEDLGQGVRRVLARNPSPMTFRGTNTYLVGQGDVAVIDPGPLDMTHGDAILAALAPGERITHIFVTHAHLDHSPLARPLAEATGAQVHAFGHARAGRSAVMENLAAEGAVGGGEGVDAGFAPDIALPDGAVLEGGDWQLRVLHTPGHFGNHISLALGEQLFSGDLVMGWSTSLVSPPDGDLTEFMASCRRLEDERWTRFLPGHGAPVDTPRARLTTLIAHREAREAQILEALRAAPGSAADIASRVYTDVSPALLPAAARNVLAHLIDLAQKNRVAGDEDLRAGSVFRLA